MVIVVKLTIGRAESIKVFHRNNMRSYLVAIKLEGLLFRTTKSKLANKTASRSMHILFNNVNQFIKLIVLQNITRLVRAISS